MRFSGKFNLDTIFEGVLLELVHHQQKSSLITWIYNNLPIDSGRSRKAIVQFAHRIFSLAQDRCALFVIWPNLPHLCFEESLCAKLRFAVGVERITLHARLSFHFLLSTFRYVTWQLVKRDLQNLEYLLCQWGGLYHAWIWRIWKFYINEIKNMYFFLNS